MKKPPHIMKYIKNDEFLYLNNPIEKLAFIYICCAAESINQQDKIFSSGEIFKICKKQGIHCEGDNIVSKFLYRGISNLNWFFNFYPYNHKLNPKKCIAHKGNNNGINNYIVVYPLDNEWIEMHNGRKSLSLNNLYKRVFLKNKQDGESYEQVF